MSTTKTIWDLDTPALVLDWPVAQSNLQKAADFVRGKLVRLRPHFKNHKCVTLAKRQLETGGCVGITAAKLGEAEILLANGVDNVLIANQIVGPLKVARLVEAAKKGTLRVAVDSIENATEISTAAKAQGMQIGVLIEVDIGMERCGVPPGDEAVKLAARIAELPGVRFDGIQAYEGHAVGVMDVEERAAVTRKCMQLAIDTRRQMEAAGIPVNILSGGSAATYRVTGSMPGVDELQVGSYATMDWSYRERVAGEFDVALAIVTTVISASPNRFVLDVGVKGVGDEMGPPRLLDYPQFPIARFLSEEHGTIVAPGHQLKVGDKVKLTPSHCCTTCNFYRQMVVHENERVIDTWAIEGSGALQ